jgi:hypothetical protein
MKLPKVEIRQNNLPGAPASPYFATSAVRHGRPGDYRVRTAKWPAAAIKFTKLASFLRGGQPSAPATYPQAGTVIRPVRISTSSALCSGAIGKGAKYVKTGTLF